MALFIYGTATNTGKGFFTHEDRRNFFLRGYSGHDGSNPIDVWVVGNNEKGALWLAEASGTEKTKAEAQAWKTIWSAGQGVTSIDDVKSTEALIEQLKAEFKIALEQQQENYKKYC